MIRGASDSFSEHLNVTAFGAIGFGPSSGWTEFGSGVSVLKSIKRDLAHILVMASFSVIRGRH